jgi:pimeloyl-ACP methyl ester carboxylesterase
VTGCSITDIAGPGGRTLEVMTGGAVDGFPLLFHYGTPTAVVEDEPLHRVCEELGLRLLSYSRPGYGGSTPRPSAGRVVDDVEDMRVVLDHAGVRDFVTLGWSGGGPRALAAASAMPDRCRAAATLAGVAPFDAEGLDWTAGMGPENVEDTEAALRGPEAYHAFLEQTMPPFFAASADQIAAALGQLASPVDAAALTGATADHLARSNKRAGAQGVVGVRDDGLAMTAPWGFDVTALTVPVAVWQGRQDAMVPFEHGVWLADHIPGARRHLFEDEGHISLVGQMDRILADLLDLAGLS